jgi:CPA1 family monovalent cation:H+ antiporter
LTFAVIFSTLVFQGMTLPGLIKKLGIQPDPSTKEIEDKARYAMAASLIEHIEENYSLGLDDRILNKIKVKYEMRIQRLKKEPDGKKLTEEQIKQFLDIQHALISQERMFLENMRKKGEIGDEALRKIERELDLEESSYFLEGSMPSLYHRAIAFSMLPNLETYYPSELMNGNRSLDFRHKFLC